MVQKYQNEIAPIFYYGISTKTNENDLKVTNLQPPDWKSPYWMTLYVVIGSVQALKSNIMVPSAWRWVLLVGCASLDLTWRNTFNFYYTAFNFNQL